MLINILFCTVFTKVNYSEKVAKITRIDLKKVLYFESGSGQNKLKNSFFCLKNDKTLMTR